MPKIGDITTTRKTVTFVDDGELKMSVKNKGNRITSIDLTYKGVNKTYEVIKYNILKAWKQAEEFLIQEDERLNKLVAKTKSNSNARVKKQTSVLAVRALEARGLQGSKTSKVRKAR